MSVPEGGPRLHLFVERLPRRESASEATARRSTERVFRWWDYALFSSLTVINFGAVYYFLSYWFERSNWIEHRLLLVALTVPTLVSLVLYESRWIALPLMRKPRERPPTPGWSIAVATTFVPGAEPLGMLEETVTALAALAYPHDTWVLDEGDDEEVKALCRRLGAFHFTRKNLPRYQTESGLFESRTKHGNYNAWLTEIAFDRYELVAAFDPDHVPDPDFLLRVIGQFDDREIGYVQAAQVYYNQAASFIARGAAEETYAYYSSVQMTSYALGYPIITGCHNTHRVTALRSIGGFAPHEADDLLMTMMYRARGWKGVYLPIRLAVGLTPVDWGGYLNQQRRWARSVLDVKFRLHWRLARNLPVHERVVSLLHGLYYLHGLGSALFVALIGFMLSTGAVPSVFSYQTLTKLLVLVLAVQLCEFYRQRFFLDPKTEGGLHWRAGLLRYAKWPHVLLALYEAVSGKRHPYVITRKVAAAGKEWTVAACHGVIAAFVIGAWAVGVARGLGTNTVLAASAGVIVVSSLAVSFTTLLRHPDPYDPKLRTREAEFERETGLDHRDVVDAGRPVVHQDRAAKSAAPVVAPMTTD